MQAVGGSCVYVISGTNGLCKIGISTDPETRLATLQTASAVPLKIVYTLVTDTDPRMIEAEAHRLLDKHRCAGEWFDIPPQVATEAVILAAENFGIKLRQTTSDALLTTSPRSRADRISMLFFYVASAMVIAAFVYYYFFMYLPLLRG